RVDQIEEMLEQPGVAALVGRRADHKDVRAYNLVEYVARRPVEIGCATCLQKRRTEIFDVVCTPRQARCSGNVLHNVIDEDECPGGTADVSREPDYRRMRHWSLLQPAACWRGTEATTPGAPAPLPNSRSQPRS